MSPRLRLVPFGLACAALAPAAWRVAERMPRFGDHPSPYGDAINALATAERHVTNMVSAINFDYRGFDTLGEECMLMGAVTGAVVLLRGGRGEQLAAHPGEVQGRPILPRSEAATLATRLVGPLVMLFGLYVILHAMTTPGGGFQGGVIVATGWLLVFVGESYRAWRRVVRSHWLDACEGLGAALYAACGFAGVLAGVAFLTNILPFGSVRDVFSGGLVQLENAGVACAVAGGFGLLFGEFLEETRAIEPGESDCGEEPS